LSGRVKKVLLVDFELQAGLTTGLEFGKGQSTVTIKDMLEKGTQQRND
jgi:cellulose biosynthesis protein BcsQ